MPIDVDAQFHRAVDIVQSLPKGGPVQTSYEEKLWLYSLYKQATEGDIRVSRPGMLDMLGRAKWDSWNKQRGVDKEKAKGLYVAALLKILRRFTDRTSTQGYIDELESFTIPHDRPASPASSSSSYHSSQASPPASTSYLPPDPTLPAPDVADSIIPPSLLSSSHRSLLNLGHSQPTSLPDQPSAPPHLGSVAGSTHGALTANAPHQSGNRLGGPSNSLPPSRAPSLLGGEYPRKDSVHSFRRKGGPPTPSILGLLPEQSGQTSRPTSRPYTPDLSGSGPSGPVTRDFGLHSYPTHGYPTHPGQGLTPNPGQYYSYTPEMTNLSASPYMGLQQPTPTYPSRLHPNQNHPAPGSTSTYNQIPPPINIPQTLQSIQISLTALHERLTSLERSQGMLMRQERNKSWGNFFLSPSERGLGEDDNLDPGEGIAGGRGEGRWGVNVDTRTKRGLRVRTWWFLMRLFRRAVFDAGVGILIGLIVLFVMRGGWRGGRLKMKLLGGRIKAMIGL